MKHTSVQQALQFVADHPFPATDETIQLPAHELIARALIDIANNPDAGTRGSLTRANKARKMIFDRLVGKRRAGSHPATRVEIPITFIDLTAGELDS